MGIKKRKADREELLKTLSDRDIVTEPKTYRRQFLQITGGCLVGAAAFVAGCRGASDEFQPVSGEAPKEEGTGLEGTVKPAFMPATEELEGEFAATWTDTATDNNDVRRLADVGSLYNGTDKSVFRDPFKNQDKPKK